MKTEKEELQELIQMKLHETKEIHNGAYVITRVPGGWIYDRQEPKVNISNVVFVPFTTHMDNA